jgi:hypothetical protein
VCTTAHDGEQVTFRHGLSLTPKTMGDKLARGLVFSVWLSFLSESSIGEVQKNFYEVAPAPAGGLIGRDSLCSSKEVGPLGPVAAVPEHFFYCSSERSLALLRRAAPSANCGKANGCLDCAPLWVPNEKKCLTGFNGEVLNGCRSREAQRQTLNLEGFSAHVP